MTSVLDQSKTALHGHAETCPYVATAAGRHIVNISQVHTFNLHPARTGGASALFVPQLGVREKKKTNSPSSACDNTSHRIGPSGELMMIGIYDDSEGMNVGSKG